MTMRSLAPARPRARLLLVPLGLAVFAAAPFARAAKAHPVTHPVAHVSARSVLATHPAPRRVYNHVPQTDKPSPKPAPHTKQKSKPGTAARGSHPVAPHSAPRQVPQPKSKHHRLRPEDEADNDPPVLVRTKSRNAKRGPNVAPKPSAPKPSALKLSARKPGASKAVSKPLPPRPSSPRLAAAAVHLSAKPNTLAAAAPPPAHTLRSADFLRAAGSPAAETEVAPAASDQAMNVAAAPILREPARTLPQPDADSITSAPLPPAHPLTQSHSRRLQMPETALAKEAVIDEALAAPLPTLSAHDGRLVVPPPLKGTREILEHQNEMADQEGLTRIQDDDDLNRMRNQHLLVALTSSSALEINPELPANRRYARPWTAKFVADIAHNFSVRFGEPLRLNSAVRTVHYQIRLQRVNGNAAGIEGETASPHLTGQAIDFGKRGMSVAEIAWMRAYLTPLIEDGKIDVEEEFQQACFHISVYQRYVPAPHTPPTRVELAKLHKLAHAIPADDDSQR